MLVTTSRLHGGTPRLSGTVTARMYPSRTGTPTTGSGKAKGPWRPEKWPTRCTRWPLQPPKSSRIWKGCRKPSGAGWGTDKQNLNRPDCQRHTPRQMKKGQYYDQAQSVYADRASGGNCHYCDFDGDIDAGAAAGERAGQGDNLPGQDR